jgi:hypothetical protein
MADSKEIELEKVCVALGMQFENVNQSSREEAEKFLNMYATREDFVPDCLTIIRNVKVLPEIKKACCIFMDKKIMTTSNIREIPENELKLTGEALLEGLCDENISNDLKTYLKTSLQSLTYGQIERNLKLIRQLYLVKLRT